MDFSSFIIQVLNGFNSILILILVALGLVILIALTTLIFTSITKMVRKYLIRV